MKKFAWLLGLILLIGCTVNNDQPAVETNINWMHDIVLAKEAAKSEDKPILIDFYTEWCGWCKRLDKDTYSNTEVQKKLSDFICVKIDAEQNIDLAKEYKINGFPSTAFLESDGKLIEVIPGYMPPDDFLKILDQMLQKAG